MTIQETFDLAYVLSKPDGTKGTQNVQALWAGSLGLPGTALTPSDRVNLAISLAKSGNIIDGQIDALGADPFYTTEDRINNGFTWYPNILQPDIATPLKGVIVPGYSQYDPSNPPSGSIILSLVPPPPFEQAPPPPPPPSLALLGIHLFANMWDATMYAIKNCNNGDQKNLNLVTGLVDSSGPLFTFTEVSTITGLEYLWETT